MMYYRVPGRAVLTTSIGSWIKMTFWCHVVLRLFPNASEPVYFYGPFVSFGGPSVYVLDGSESWMLPREGEETQMGGRPYPEEVLKAFRIAAQEEREIDAKIAADRAAFAAEVDKTVADANAALAESDKLMEQRAAYARLDIGKAMSEGSYNQNPDYAAVITDVQGDGTSRT